MAEVEVGGIKFSGGKFFIVISVISTLAGSLWAGFEFYADYMDMKEIVQEINIDEIKAENELVISKLDSAIVYTRDIKNNLRDDLMKLEAYIDKLEGKIDKSDKKIDTSGISIKSTQASIDLVLEGVLNEMNQVQKDVTVSIREVEALIRESEKDVRNNLRETEDRLDRSMKKLEDNINQRLQELLDNPLSN